MATRVGNAILSKEFGALRPRAALLKDCLSLKLMNDRNGYPKRADEARCRRKLYLMAASTIDCYDVTMCQWADATQGAFDLKLGLGVQHPASAARRATNRNFG